MTPLARVLGPALDFVERPSKGIRRALVPIGVTLAGPRRSVDPAAVTAVQRAIEWIHAGSLIVDDIQDDAPAWSGDDTADHTADDPPSRRGQPPLHRTHGLANALGGGLWLTFSGLAGIAHSGVDPQTELSLYRMFGHALVRAARGQALDVGTDIRTVPQAEVTPLCREAIADKTGALVSLPLLAGARLAGAEAHALEIIGRFGERLGAVLQMFNDLGDVRGDMLRGRPSWVFATAARTLDPPTYARLADPDAAWASIAAVLQAHDLLTRARSLALDEMRDACDQLRGALDVGGGAIAWGEIESLSQTIAAAYRQDGGVVVRCPATIDP